MLNVKSVVPVNAQLANVIKQETRKRNQHHCDRNHDHHELHLGKSRERKRSDLGHRKGSKFDGDLSSCEYLRRWWISRGFVVSENRVKIRKSENR